MKQYQKNNSIPSVWFDIILMLLACVAGSTDILSYFRLGHAFTANMIGNMVLLGISIGKGALSTSLYRFASLVGFFIGVFIGALIVVQKKRVDLLGCISKCRIKKKNKFGKLNPYYHDTRRISSTCR
ncbi:MAG TPA: YoaK family protein [Hanamia sp.]|nr:YoaK family protein [Hanamia sp.]